MQIKLRGLAKDKMPSGNYRLRVRPKGNPKKWITLTCDETHSDFSRQYNLARQGIKIELAAKEEGLSNNKGTIGWLINEYFRHFENLIKGGSRSDKTLKKKKILLKVLLINPNRGLNIPKEYLQQLHDSQSNAPTMADDTITAIKVLYEWAIDRGYVKGNPAIGIKRYNVYNGGAKEWTKSDIMQFFAYHKEGTIAHTIFSFLIWTGCRIEEITKLGKHNEKEIKGKKVLQFQPSKKGSKLVTIPIMPQLQALIDSIPRDQDFYILTKYGKPYSTANSASAMAIKYCKQAGLNGLSSHGVRKGFSTLLYEKGITIQEIAAILGHSTARSTQVYVERSDRIKLSEKAFNSIDMYLEFFKDDNEVRNK